MAYLPSNSSMTPELMKAFQEFLKQQISSSPAPSSRYTAGQLREHPGLAVSGVNPALIPPPIGGRGNRGNAGMNAKRRAYYTNTTGYKSGRAPKAPATQAEADRNQSAIDAQFAQAGGGPVAPKWTPSTPPGKKYPSAKFGWEQNRRGNQPPTPAIKYGDMAEGDASPADSARIASGNFQDTDFNSMASGGKSGIRQAYGGATRPGQQYNIEDLDREIAEEQERERLRNLRAANGFSVPPSGPGRKGARPANP